MRRAVCIVLIAVVVVLPGGDETPSPNSEGAVVARDAIRDYSHRLSELARDAADDLLAGDLSTDKELEGFIAQRQDDALAKAWQPLMDYQEERTGGEFNAQESAQLMREFAEGWK